MGDISNEDNRIGAILAREGLIDAFELEAALSLQAAGRVYKPIGAILKSLGYISGDKLREVMQDYGKWILLGELLLKMGAISDNQAKEALAIQKRSAKKLGLILLEKGFIKKTLLADALCLQLGIDGVNAADCRADSALFEKVNAAFLRARRIMPLGYNKETNTVTLLMEDPTDGMTLAHLEKIFGAIVEPVMLRDGLIEHLIGGVPKIRPVAWWRNIGRSAEEGKGPKPNGASSEIRLLPLSHSSKLDR
jgi:hypothetical protein